MWSSSVRLLKGSHIQYVYNLAISKDNLTEETSNLLYQTILSAAKRISTLSSLTFHYFLKVLVTLHPDNGQFKTWQPDLSVSSKLNKSWSPVVKHSP